MTFAPKEVIIGATLPLENGSTVTFSIAGHVEAERDIDDAVVIFGRKLLKYRTSGPRPRSRRPWSPRRPLRP
jgi:hypothetical protein